MEMISKEQSDRIGRACEAFMDAIQAESGNDQVLVTWSVKQENGDFIGGFSHGELTISDLGVMLVQMVRDASS